MAAPPISERHLPHFHRRAPVKELVRAATTGNITISTALNNGDTLDGVTLATGDRVLVKDQSTDSQNGIYVVGASPARDYDLSTDDPGFGYLVIVIQGTVNAGTFWLNTNTSAPTVGSTSITFDQFTPSFTPSGSITASGYTMSTARLLGRTTASTGAIEEITVGSGLSLSAGSLTATGGGTGTVDTATDGSTTVSSPDTIEITGSGGIAVTVSESPSGTAAFVVDGSGVSGGGGSSDAILGQSGVGGARISGLQGSPDIDVGGGSDDEFNTTDTSDPMTGWTTLGTPTAHDINSTALGHYFVSKAAGSLSLTGIYKSWTPSAGSTVTCKLSAFASEAGAVDAQSRAGLFVSVASPGKILSIGRNGGFSSLSQDVWSSPTAFTNSNGTATIYGSPWWFRIVYNSSTSLTFQWSVDGLLWWNLATAINPSATIAAAGLYIDPNAAGGTIKAAFDWIRFT